MRLYDLTDEWLRVAALAEDAGFDEETGDYGDPGPELTAELDGIGGAVEKKLVGVAMVLRGLLAEAEVVKLEERRLSARRKSLERSAAYLSDYGRDAMIATEKTKIKGALFTISLRTALPPVVVAEGAELSEEYLQPAVERAPDKRALTKALKDGESIDGVSWGTPKRSMVIR